MKRTYKMRFKTAIEHCSSKISTKCKKLYISYFSDCKSIHQISSRAEFYFFNDTYCSDLLRMLFRRVYFDVRLL